MRLSEYPHVIVRIGCVRCARQGQYRQARLAERYGSEIEMAKLLSHLAGDCKFRDTRRGSADFCGAFFPDMSRGRQISRYGSEPSDDTAGRKSHCSFN